MIDLIHDNAINSSALSLMNCITNEDIIQRRMPPWVIRSSTWGYFIFQVIITQQPITFPLENDPNLNSRRTAISKPPNPRSIRDMKCRYRVIDKVLFLLKTRCQNLFLNILETYLFKLLIYRLIKKMSIVNFYFLIHELCFPILFLENVVGPTKLSISTNENINVFTKWLH